MMASGDSSFDSNEEVEVEYLDSSFEDKKKFEEDGDFADKECMNGSDTSDSDVMIIEEEIVTDPVNGSSSNSAKLVQNSKKTLEEPLELDSESKKNKAEFWDNSSESNMYSPESLETDTEPVEVIKESFLEDSQKNDKISTKIARDPEPMDTNPPPSKSVFKPVPLGDKIFNLLQTENSPLLLTEVHEKIGKTYDRKAIEKILEEQVRQGKLISKTYSKLVIYCINNKIKSEANKSDIKALDDKIQKYQQKMNTKQQRISLIETQINKKSNGPEASIGSLRAENSELTDVVNKLQSQADEMKRGDKSKQQMDPKDLANIQREHERYLQEYTKRKRLCMNLIDAILEGYPKSKQKLIEDTEIETDEAAGFNINQYK